MQYFHQKYEYVKVDHMKKNIKFLKYQLQIFLVLIFLMGCNSNKTLEIPISSTQIIISKTNESIIKKISTPPILEIEQTPNITPIITLNPEATQQEIQRLMETNNGCSEFCFWGITPGITSFNQAVDFLNNLKDTKLQQKDGRTQYEQYFTDKDGKIQFGVIFSNTDGMIISLTASASGLNRLDVSSNEWRAFRPDNFIRNNGIPKQVLIVMATGPEGRVDYDMTLVYDQGYINYGSNQTLFLPQHILHACPLINHNISGFVMKAGQYDERTLHDVGVVDLRKVSEINVEEFSNLLTGDLNTACFNLDYNKYLAEN